ncbi:MAG: hypothetical protein Q7R90_04210, partial [bacterium]|nr:hypothetical protein [bacterium]
MKKFLLILPFVLLLPQAASATTIYLTSGTSWTVPADWNSSNNTIEVIGGGGGGENGTGTFCGRAGGGGAYTRSINLALTSGSTATYRVGAGGIAGTKDLLGGYPGGDTYFNATSLTNAVAKGPSVAVAAEHGSSGLQPTGGSAANSVGLIKHNGGNGGNSGGIPSLSGGAGGGGAAGPNGNGNAGSNCPDVFLSPPPDGIGGSGDAGFGGAAGANGTEWNSTHGSGGVGIGTKDTPGLEGKYVACGAIGGYKGGL